MEVADDLAAAAGEQWTSKDGCVIQLAVPGASQLPALWKTDPTVSVMTHCWSKSSAFTYNNSAQYNQVLPLRFRSASSGFRPLFWVTLKTLRNAAQLMLVQLLVIYRTLPAEDICCAIFWSEIRLIHHTCPSRNNGTSPRLNKFIMSSFCDIVRYFLIFSFVSCLTVSTVSPVLRRRGRRRRGLETGSRKQNISYFLCRKMRKQRSMLNLSFCFPSLCWLKLPARSLSVCLSVSH